MTVIESISHLNIGLIGCDEDGHGENVLCKLIPYYIKMRFYFYTRSMKRDVMKLTSTQRKLSRLQSFQTCLCENYL